MVIICNPDTETGPWCGYKLHPAARSAPVSVHARRGDKCHHHKLVKRSKIVDTGSSESPERDGVFGPRVREQYGLRGSGAQQARDARATQDGARNSRLEPFAQKEDGGRTCAVLTDYDRPLTFAFLTGQPLIQ
ncbi:hypothetical protein BaRGS_00031596 [Batillaria attramentaria]|uniref:Uncharacterized protein n=1 Tax=Batillaria attramentaria TaxID=370345 RepID=A0ABD0JPZ6_9CAEN